jgi:tetratricopeptide (TPR) repeat protein
MGSWGKQNGAERMSTKRSAMDWFLEGYRLDTEDTFTGEAVDAYKKALKLDGNLTDAYVNLGFVYLRREEYEKARKCFSEVLDREPRNPVACNNLGYVYEKMERFGTAKRLYEKALQLNPGDAEAYINIGNIADLQGDYSAAIEQYKRAIEVKPASANARFCLAVLYERHDMFDVAIEEYRQILARDPNHLKSLFNLGGLCIQQGMYQEGARNLEMVVVLDPNNADAWNNLGSLCEEMGDIEKAISYYNKSISLNAFQEEAHFNLAHASLRRSSMGFGGASNEEVKMRLKFLLSLNPKSAKVHRFLQELERSGA